MALGLSEEDAWDYAHVQMKSWFRDMSKKLDQDAQEKFEVHMLSK